ncbi:hypothetical protein GCM10027289_00990 [Tsukamurella serpentis]
MTEPVRTCIGCRGRAPARELIRVVAQPAAEHPAAEDPGGGLRVVIDTGHRLPGRGAWLHDDPRCIDSARKRNAFRRALRVSGRLDDSLA